MRLFDYLLYRFVGIVGVGLFLWCFFVELPYIEDAEVKARDALQGMVVACEARNNHAASLEAALSFSGGKALSEAKLAELKTAHKAVRQVRLYPQRATADEVQEFWTAHETHRLTAASVAGLMQKANTTVQAQFTAVIEASEVVTAAASRYNLFAAVYNKRLRSWPASVTAYFAGYTPLPVLNLLPAMQS